MEALGTQLRDEAKNSSKLILWLDCDREGEYIAYEVMEQCLKTNRNLDCVRARFSAFVPK
jgi:DNA topoisomerase-3